MTTVNLGWRITCDGCGTRFDYETEHGQPPPSSLHEWTSDSALRVWGKNMLIRALAQEGGWITTTSRGGNGQFANLWIDRDSDGRKHPVGKKGAVYDACPTCAPTWVPPYSRAAQLEMDRLERLNAAADGTDGQRLMDLERENERMRAELATLRGQEATV